jgi:hypothetical protein
VPSLRSLQGWEPRTCKSGTGNVETKSSGRNRRAFLKSATLGVRQIHIHLAEGRRTFVTMSRMSKVRGRSRAAMCA